MKKKKVAISHTVKFRPSEVSKKMTMRNRRMGDPYTFKFPRRIDFVGTNWAPNQIAICKIHARLHHLACHAPEPVQKQWRTAYNVLTTKLFGTDLATVRYLNTFSCHSWM